MPFLAEHADQMTIYAVLVVALALFIQGRWRYDLVALGALLVVALTGLVPADEAFEGFGHPAVITVAAVLVLSKGLLNAGVVDVIARLLSRVGNRPLVQMAVLTLVVMVCSGFMNNVGALALLIPVAVWMARNSGYSPSRLLLPLAFGSLLGGMTTLIGTPPNIIIASYRAEAGVEPFGMFDFLPVGASVAVAGLVVICALAHWLVPERQGQGDNDELFAIQDYLAEVRVSAESKAVGVSLHDVEAAAGEDADVLVVGLIRGGRKRLAPSPYEVLQADDVLLVEADSDNLTALVDALNLQLAESEPEQEGKPSLRSDDVSVMEAVVSHNSPLVGNTAAALSMRQRYGVNLLAVARHGKRLRQRLSRLHFVTGDILLLQGPTETLNGTLGELGLLPLAQRGLRLGRPRRVLLAAGIFTAGLIATAGGLAPVQIALVTAAVVMVLARVLSLREAYEAIDWPILLLLGAMIPVGQAFETTGAADLLANQIAAVGLWAGPAAALAVLLVGTMVLSNVINNAAAAVLMAPIALSIADTLDKSADPFLMAVAVAASAAFMTPIGHQSNTLVMEPGGYKFGDYWQLGLPVSVAVTLTALPVILWVWPL